MVSNAPPDRAVSLEWNVMVSVHFDGVESLEAAYAAMSEGTEIAMLKDKFAIGWMLSYTYPAGAKG